MPKGDGSRFKGSLMDWLLSHVNKTETCWLWTGALGERGYPHTRRGRGHRVMYELVHGKIPKGMHVLHKCDVRNCVNPEHLFLGTDKDNKNDMLEKGRLTRSGETGQFVKTVGGWYNDKNIIYK